VLQQSFRLASKDDIPAVGNMRRRVFGAQINANDENYLKWRYFSHPGLASTLWIFEYQGAVIGAMGTEFVELINGDRCEPAIRSMDAIVDPEFDNRGLGAWMTLVLQARYDCILVCGGNEKSRSMLRKLFHPLPMRQGYKLMLASNSYLQRKTAAPVAALLSPVVNILLAVHHRMKWLRLSAPGNVELRTLKSVDELIEILPATPGFLGEVKVYRSREYLAWRYRDNPLGTFRVKAAFSGGRLLGYAIYNLDGGNARDPVAIGRIADWDIFTTEATRDLLALLFQQVAKDCGRLKAEQIFITLSDEMSAEAAAKTGFILRNPDSEFFVYHKSAQPGDAIFSPGSWYQSISDSDAEGI
jgi:hypothetical protein